MTETLITITDAASISGKSIQTIRRAIKAKKIKVKKQKTPQGFNYLIIKDTLLEWYGSRPTSELRDIPIERHEDAPIVHLDIQETHGVGDVGTGSEVVGGGSGASDVSHVAHIAGVARAEFVASEAARQQALIEYKQEIARTDEAILKLDEKLASAVSTYSGEREQITQVLRDFKDRILVLENQIRLLNAPKKKWYQFWG
jgi:hypothetical protein